MGKMMPETCWVNLLWINIYICVICWFFILLRQWCTVTRTWSLCERYLILDNLTTVFKSFKFSFMYIVNNLKESNLPWHNNFLKPAADGPGNWECNWTVRAGTVYDDGCCVLLERNSLNIYECKKSLINIMPIVWCAGAYAPEHQTRHRAVRSARVPTPHNRSQHIKANTTRGFIQSVLLTMGIMMPEICWVNLLWINIYTCVICWFFLLLR